MLVSGRLEHGLCCLFLVCWGMGRAVCFLYVGAWVRLFVSCMLGHG